MEFCSFKPESLDDFINIFSNGSWPNSELKTSPNSASRRPLGNEKSRSFSAFKLLSSFPTLFVDSVHLAGVTRAVRFVGSFASTRAS